MLFEIREVGFLDFIRKVVRVGLKEDLLVTEFKEIENAFGG